MKITVERDALHGALAGATKVAHGRVIPILGCVLLTAAKTGLTISATDTDTTIIREIDAKVHRAGEVPVDAVKLQAIVSNIPSGAQIEIEKTDLTVKVRSGRSHFKLQCLDERDFPQAGKVKGEKFELDSAALARALQFSSTAAGSETTRYYLMGVFIEPIADGLVFTGTDGKRLHSTAVTAKVPQFKPVIVPKAACLLITALAALSDTVEITVSETLIEARGGRNTVRSKLIDGGFPDWRRIVTAHGEAFIEIPLTTLRESVQRVIPLAFADKTGHVVHLRGRDNLLTVVGADTQSNDMATDEVDAAVTGQFPDIAFYVRQLADCLDVVTGDTVKIIPSGSTVVIKGDGPETDILIVMPVGRPFPVEQIKSSEAA